MSSWWICGKQISKSEEWDASSHLVAPSVSDKHLFTSRFHLNIIVSHSLKLRLSVLQSVSMYEFFHMCPLPVTWMWSDCVWESSEGATMVCVCVYNSGGIRLTAQCGASGGRWRLDVAGVQGSAAERVVTVTTRGVGRVSCHSASAEKSPDVCLRSQPNLKPSPEPTLYLTKFKRINSNESQIYFLCFCWPLPRQQMGTSHPFLRGSLPGVCNLNRIQMFWGGKKHYFSLALALKETFVYFSLRTYKTWVISTNLIFRFSWLSTNVKRKSCWYQGTFSRLVLKEVCLKHLGNLLSLFTFFAGAKWHDWFSLA